MDAVRSHVAVLVTLFVYLGFYTVVAHAVKQQVCRQLVLYMKVGALSSAVLVTLFRAVRANFITCIYNTIHMYIYICIYVYRSKEPKFVYVEFNLYMYMCRVEFQIGNWILAFTMLFLI